MQVWRDFWRLEHQSRDSASYSQGGFEQKKGVSHHLTDAPKLNRVMHSEEMISFAQNIPNFTKSILTENETWCLDYDQELGV